MKLERETNLKIVGRAYNGEEALELVTANPPDLLLIDMDMPLMTGLEVVRFLHQRGVESKVLPLSGHADPEYVMGTLEAGASGYVMKNESLSTIVNAVKEVLRGGVYISPRVSQQIVTRQMNSHNREKEIENATQQLLKLGITPKLLRILLQVAQGQNNAQIAEKMFKSEHTVRNQVDRLKAASGVRWRPAIVAWAWRLGVFEIDVYEYEKTFEEAEFVRKNKS